MPHDADRRSESQSFGREPADKEAFITEMDQSYSRFARVYDYVAKYLPLWQRWIGHTLPHIQGPRVLEISCGTGWLLCQYAGRFESYAIDYNDKMTRIASDNVKAAGLTAEIQQATIEALPYCDESFDSIVNTMSFTGYPDGAQAMREISRVLRPGGRFVMVDVNYPLEESWLGNRLARMWASFGDILRDMGALFDYFGFRYVAEEVGGFGSVHLYVATKSEGTMAETSEEA
jgi:ubiquinone/menaquinone biosynthesis C-methylase UbiE